MRETLGVAIVVEVVEHELDMLPPPLLEALMSMIGGCGKVQSLKQEASEEKRVVSQLSTMCHVYVSSA